MAKLELVTNEDLQTQMNVPFNDNITHWRELIPGKRMELPYEVDRYMNYNSYGCELLPMESKPVQDASFTGSAKCKAEKHPVKLIDSKKLNKYLEDEVKGQISRNQVDTLDMQSCRGYQSAIDETSPFSKSYARDDTEPQGTGLKGAEKTCTRAKPIKSHQSAIAELKVHPRTKREIMVEYSKTVAASRFVKGNKCSFKTSKLPEPKCVGALDEEIAKILHF